MECNPVEDSVGQQSFYRGSTPTSWPQPPPTTSHKQEAYHWEELTHEDDAYYKEAAPPYAAVARVPRVEEQGQEEIMEDDQYANLSEEDLISMWNDNIMLFQAQDTMEEEEETQYYDADTFYAEEDKAYYGLDEGYLPYSSYHPRHDNFEGYDQGGWYG